MENKVKDIAQHFKQILSLLGENLNREDLIKTPERYAKFLVEFLARPFFDFTTFSAEGMSEMVVQSRIPFFSLCAHHLLPMVGFASVGYIPNKRLAGLSKLARAVQYFSHELQTQERITRQTAMFLQERLNPIGVGVWIKAEHSCLSIRGVRAPGTLTTTVYLIGAMKEDPKTREEFLRAASS